MHYFALVKTELFEIINDDEDGYSDEEDEK